MSPGSQHGSELGKLSLLRSTKKSPAKNRGQQRDQQIWCCRQRPESQGKAPPKADRRETKTMEPRASFGPGGHVGEGETRRIVGVLISYTWRPEGDLYPIREGRNYIGRGKISSDAYHRNCDVMIPEDDRMSGTHALILCRHGNYEIIDQEASNGTFLNGEMLMANTSTKLTNYAEVKTGHTLWTFIKIEVSRTAQPALPPKKTPEQTSSQKDNDTRGDTIVR